MPAARASISARSGPSPTNRSTARQKRRGLPEQPTECQSLHHTPQSARLAEPVALPTNHQRDAEDRGGTERQPVRGVRPAVNNERVEAPIPEFGDDPCIDETE